MSESIIFNTNYQAAVLLTDLGRAILRKRHEEMQSRVPHLDMGAWDRKIDETGWYRDHLWSIMQIFGPHLSLGSVMPFETQIHLFPERR